VTKSKKLLSKIKEAFMEKQVFQSKGVAIDTSNGTMYLPSDVIDPDRLDFEGDSTDDEEVIAKIWDDIKDYVEVRSSDQVHSIEKVNGWFGRLSAPGYMDSTDYTFGQSEKEVSADLDRMYGNDDEEGEVEESFKKKAVDTIKNKEEARQLAVDWQNWQSERKMSWGEVAKWGTYFSEVAKKFGLTKEFEENGII
jgi:hypothetical protein